MELFIPYFKPLGAHLELLDLFQKLKGPKGTNPKLKVADTGTYSAKYNESIGLYGRWYAILRPRNSTRVIWTGKELQDFETSETLSNDEQLQSIRCGLPKSVPLDGWLFKYKNEYFYEIFDTFVVNLSYEQRRIRLATYEKRFRPKTSLCEYSSYACLFREFAQLAEEFQRVLSDEKYHPSIYLIEGKSVLRNSNGESYREFIVANQGQAEIVEFIEGCFSLRGRLAKFKCRDLKTGRFFYCSKHIPEHIRNAYVFSHTKLLRIETPETVPKLGDTLCFSCVEVLEHGLPREAFYEGFQPKAGIP